MQPLLLKPPAPPASARPVDRATLSRPAAPPSVGVLASAALTGLAAAVTLRSGIGANLLVCAAVLAGGAGVTAHRTGRRIRPWTVLWTVAVLALLAVPVVSASAWPTLLAVCAALGIGSLALHGGRRWAGVGLGLLGLWAHLGPAVGWAAAALRALRYPGRTKLAVAVRTAAVTAVLLIVFGLLFGTADSQVGSILGSMLPTVSVGDTPLRVLLFALGTLLALTAAHTAAAPRRWDRTRIPAGRQRSRLEWALPLGLLNLLFGVFVGVQLAVLFRSGSIYRRTGLFPAEYARQGFWQLLWVLVLTLLVVALATYWAPRSTAGDRRLVKSMLGLLCTLTLVVVVSALYRMKLYVDAFGLSRLRLSVAGVEIWLGVVFVLLIAGGILSSRAWLPRAVVLSAAVGLAVYGLIRPDALIAEQNVARYRQTGQIDIGYLRDLSADAAPALDGLPDDMRACALQGISDNAVAPDAPWYAISLSDARTRAILRARPVTSPDDACARIGVPLYNPLGE
ncbi:DUF4153 domain-containing protein [Streptacidiphilus rugosus]|uniref:DUF4153 domain-containing protein n=1 Tax=Streptacidiphilus rugosus TaxID=405783 RepID=UPI000AE73684|nr:DUF4173 domain-containing protein [Streptacidiphilus rugosus]